MGPGSPLRSGREDEGGGRRVHEGEAGKASRIPHTVHFAGGCMHPTLATLSTDRGSSAWFRRKKINFLCGSPFAAIAKPSQRQYVYLYLSPYRSHAFVLLGYR